MINIEYLVSYLNTHSKTIFLILLGVITVGSIGGGLWISKLQSDLENTKIIQDVKQAESEERHRLGYARVYERLDKFNYVVEENLKKIDRHLDNLEENFIDLQRVVVADLSMKQKNDEIDRIKSSFNSNLDKSHKITDEINSLIVQKNKPATKVLGEHAGVPVVAFAMVPPIILLIISIILVVWIIRLKKQIRSLKK